MPSDCTPAPACPATSCLPSHHPTPQPCPQTPQAEETAAKLRELEADMLLRRQENRRGWSCCGFVLTWAGDTLPEHLRVWEMTID